MRKRRRPPATGQSPKKNGAQESQPHVLGRGVEPDCTGPSASRTPHRDDLAVGRQTRRLGPPPARAVSRRAREIRAPGHDPLQKLSGYILPVGEMPHSKCRLCALGSKQIQIRNDTEHRLEHVAAVVYKVRYCDLAAM